MIVPTVRVTDMARAVEFYTRVLDFDHVGSWPTMADPSFTVLMRDGAELDLSSHAGDGVVGQKVIVLVDDVDALHASFVARGLDQRHRLDSPIHLGPTDQSWGAREFCADDPDGNGIIFARR
ncbi:glyoxalase superfamily protein [Sphingomonas mali]|uniref:glyoxalase superfamily protein n=1 Tax=Sphingomonas mali TaxID=40682 RepID=UPI00082AF38F|nr:glyoxalase superfamily protein [Sphingomonas mali]